MIKKVKNVTIKYSAVYVKIIYPNINNSTIQFNFQSPIATVILFCVVQTFVYNKQNCLYLSSQIY